MEKRDIIKEIIFLPVKFHEDRNISIYSLLKRSGYFELFSQISETDIFEGLNQHIECIDQWLRWSEDKRTSSGWYFKQNESGKYVVGYFSANQKLKTREYIDRVKACTAFIKKEIEDIRKS